MKNTPLARKWMKALRSGKYKQGRTSLRNQDKYCCLGVLCDVSGQGEWGSDDRYHVGATSHGGFLPHTLKGAIGISVDDESELVNLNDGSRATFEEIADAIQLIILSEE